MKLVDGQFVTNEGTGLGVWASKSRGRWQYRMGPNKSDRVLASGMEPGRFVQRFWMRDDFEEV